MKVTKNMLNEDLRKNYLFLRLLPNISKYKLGATFLNNMSKKKNLGKNIDGLNCEERYIPSRNGGPDIRIKIYKPRNITEPLPAMLYIHGGGYMVGFPEEYHVPIRNFIKKKNCIIVAPDYRKSLQEPYPAAFNDCYDTLLWIRDNAKSLGAIEDKFIVGGHSAGGGLTAAVVLKATDTQDVNIAFQIPIYPMIDDRQDTVSAKNNNAPVWNSKSNKSGWKFYLGNMKEVTPYAAPARAVDFSKLPPTITFVGDLEPFRDETVNYVNNLKKAGIPTEFKLVKGAFHGFEMLHPGAKISRETKKFLLDSYKNFMEKYF